MVPMLAWLAAADWRFVRAIRCHARYPVFPIIPSSRSWTRSRCREPRYPPTPRCQPTGPTTLPSGRSSGSNDFDINFDPPFVARFKQRRRHSAAPRAWSPSRGSTIRPSPPADCCTFDFFVVSKSGLQDHTAGSRALCVIYRVVVVVLLLRICAGATVTQ